MSEYRTHEPKALKTLEEYHIVISYAFEDVALKRLEEMAKELQDITIYPPPLYLMSPRIRLYQAQDIIRLKGYMKVMMPDRIKEMDEPTMTITITPTV